MAVMDYQTQDGLADYGFSIEFQPDLGWRIYIVFQSYYQRHDERTQSPYQANDRNGRRYVNWSAKLDSLGDARTVAALWAEITQRYQYTQEQRGITTKSGQQVSSLWGAEGRRSLIQEGRSTPGSVVCGGVR